MKSARIHFFFPSTKVDCECQTLIVNLRDTSFYPKRDNIYERMHKTAIQSLIFQEPRPTNLIDLSYMQDYNSRLGYLIANANDDRFDKLTPPSEILFQDLTVGFHVSLLDKNFIINGPDAKKSANFIYDNAVGVPIIESLESGVLGRELASALFSIKANSFEDGRILCKITDFRFEEPITFSKLLTVSYDIDLIGSPDLSMKTASNSQKIEAEKRILLLLHPEVCIDPSPDVARAESILDWRQKMWASNEKIDPKASEVQEEQALKPLETGNIELQKLEKRIRIPDSIFQVFTNFTRGNAVNA